MRLRHLLILLLFGSSAATAQSRIEGDLPRRDARPLEATPGLETLYGTVRTSEGLRLRSIVTRPAGVRAPLPAIYLVQWVSCGSTEWRPDRDNALKQLATRSGLAFVRIERAGTGDSEGGPCSALDYDTELRHYREAFDQIARHPWIDGKRIVIFGSSLGATLAPLVAQRKPVAGVLVQGGGAVTYLERMIGFDRLQLERAGQFRPEQIHQEMLRRIAFHQHYLIGRKTPTQVTAAHPELAGVWESLLGTAAGDHYGRPFAWHWQAADKDFLSAWLKITAPVMVVYGEYDRFETRHGHRLIVDAVNAQRPGSATWLEIAGAGHDLAIYPSAEAAYREEGGVRRLDLFVEPVLAWLQRVTSARK
jgi:pimeloyl-ACP methyl ester carboxylesterase